MIIVLIVILLFTYIIISDYIDKNSRPKHKSARGLTD
jgi:hypothetical protein